MTSEEVEVDDNWKFELMEEVQKFPCLYNTSSPDFQLLKKKHQAWKEVSIQLKKSEETCKMAWRNLTTYFLRITAKAKSGARMSGEFDDWKFYQKMSLIMKSYKVKHRPNFGVPLGKRSKPAPPLVPERTEIVAAQPLRAESVAAAPKTDATIKKLQANQTDRFDNVGRCLADHLRSLPPELAEFAEEKLFEILFEIRRQARNSRSRMHDSAIDFGIKNETVTSEVGENNYEEFCPLHTQLQSNHTNFENAGIGEADSTYCTCGTTVMDT